MPCYYIFFRFKSGKFSIDDLIEMAKVYNMSDKINEVLDKIADHILSNNEGDATDFIRLMNSIENIDSYAFACSFGRYGNYDAFKYVTSIPDAFTYDIFIGAYYISKERLDIVIGYYLKDGKSIEDLLIDISALIRYDGDDDDEMVYHIIENYQPDLDVVLRDVPESSLLVELTEELIENNV